MERDDEYAVALLRPLDDEPRTPSTVDVARAMADGDRRIRVTRWAAAGGVAAAVTALVLVGVTTVAGLPRHRIPPTGRPTVAPSGVASLAPVPPTSCTTNWLTQPVPSMTVVTGADPTGKYILGHMDYDGKSRAAIWQGDTMKADGVPGDQVTLTDATSTGVVVGSSVVSGKHAAWISRDGKATRLPGEDAGALAINDYGVVVGTVDGRPAMWPTPTSAPTLLGLPPGDWVGSAVGIDEDGTIVGNLHRPGESAKSLGFRWRSDGTFAQLPTPTTDGTPAASVVVHAIRNGWVTGWAGYSGGTERASSPRWNLRTGQLDNSSGIFGGGAAVNRYGWRAGYDTQNRPVLLSDAGLLVLPDPGYPGPATNWTMTVSDDGRTIAGVADAAPNHGGTAAVVWRCT